MKRSEVMRSILRLTLPVTYPATLLVLRSLYNSNMELNKLTEKKVLVLCPHVDDETIGLGATIRKYADAGAEIVCVYFSDGADSTGEIKGEDLIQLRKKEAQHAKEILGISRLIFFDIPDGKVSSDKGICKLMEDVIHEFVPDIVYTPTLVDCHPDHIAVSTVFAQLLQKMKLSLPVRLYEVNCPIPVSQINCAIDISKEFSAKKRAVSAFKSQKIDFDGFFLLSRSKATITNEKITAAETFLELQSPTFIQMVETLNWKSPQYSMYFKQVNKAATLLLAWLKNYHWKEELYFEALKD